MIKRCKIEFFLMNYQLFWGSRLYRFCFWCEMSTEQLCQSIRSRIGIFRKQLYSRFHRGYWLCSALGPRNFAFLEVLQYPLNLKQWTISKNFLLKSFWGASEGADLQEQLLAGTWWQWISKTGSLAHANIYGLANFVLKKLLGGSKGCRSSGTAGPWCWWISKTGWRLSF